jgi:hypothetical protein
VCGVCEMDVIDVARLVEEPRQSAAPPDGACAGGDEDSESESDSEALAAASSSVPCVGDITMIAAVAIEDCTQLDQEDRANSELPVCADTTAVQIDGAGADLSASDSEDDDSSSSDWNSAADDDCAVKAGGRANGPGGKASDSEEEEGVLEVARPPLTKNEIPPDDVELEPLECASPALNLRYGAARPLPTLPHRPDPPACPAAMTRASPRSHVAGA